MAAPFVASDGTSFASRKEWRKYEFELLYAFRSKSGASLVKEPGSINGQPFDLSDLSQCSVVLADATDQVQMDVLTECRVFVGAAGGSVFARNCKDCVFFVACKQLRVRDCANCVFRLCCVTEPVIEASTALSFACFRGGYPEQRGHFEQASLDPCVNFWWAVFDFTPSANEKKNYSLLVEREDDDEWFPRGPCEAVAKLTQPGSSPLPSANGGNWGGGSGSGILSFDFTTSQAQAERVHQQLQADAPPPPAAHHTAPAPPAAPPAADATPAKTPPPPPAGPAQAFLGGTALQGPNSETAPPLPGPPSGPSLPLPAAPTPVGGGGA